MYVVFMLKILLNKINFYVFFYMKSILNICLKNKIKKINVYCYIIYNILYFKFSFPLKCKKNFLFKNCMNFFYYKF